MIFHRFHRDIAAGRRLPPEFPSRATMARSLALVTLLALSGPGAGQYGTAQSKSPVLRDPAAGRSPFYLKVDRSTEILFDAFMLVKKANTGDPVAQHELGLRYLQGQDFAPDTAKAALWIGRAAEQDYLPALYNQGILKNNGWGMDWDPFGAYRNFERTAEEGMPEGMYITGLLHTDNLVVPRDYPEAYRWIKAAADSGNKYAVEVLADFEKTGIMAQIRASGKAAAKKKSSTDPKASSGAPGSSSSAWKPVFLDLATDTLADPDDTTLAREAVHSTTDRMRDRADDADSSVATDSIDLVRISIAAEAGSPEALTFLGRRYDRGADVGRDRVEAAYYYIRAVRCESRWAPVLLWRLSSGPALYDDLTRRIGRNDPKASYVWACLLARGFDNRLTQEQALDHLRRAADAGMADAMVELAMWHYAGFVVPVDNAAGDLLMARAAGLGSREAELRIVISSLRGAGGGSVDAALLKRLAAWDAEGSVLAQVILGYCHEGGRGMAADIPGAISYYRKAAQRGSRMAYDALRNLYDGRRPDDSEFSVDDSGG